MDTVSNLLTSLVNAQMVGKERVAVPASKQAQRILEVLKARGRVADMRLTDGVQPKLIVTLLYEGKQPMIRGVRRLSSPGAHQHVAKSELPYPTRGEGFYIISTSRGVMDEKKARKEGLGGELICEIW